MIVYLILLVGMAIQSLVTSLLMLLNLVTITPLQQFANGIFLLLFAFLVSFYYSGRSSSD